MLQSNAPYAFWHVDLLPRLSVDVAHEREGGVKALDSE